MNIGIGTIVIALAAFAAANEGVCPPEILIEPCVCIDRFWFKRRFETVQCTNFTSAWELEKVMAQSYDTPVPNLCLREACFLYLPSTVLNSKKPEFVTLEDSFLMSLFDRVPDPGSSVTHLELLKTRVMRGIRWNHFQNLRNLIYLKLESVEVLELGASFRDYISRVLTMFVLVSTKTKRIHADAFRDLKLLGFVSVIDSKVSNLQRSMFANPSMLTTFDFSGNRIQTLPADMFEDMPFLVMVSLKRNRIAVLPEQTFSKIFDNDVYLINLEGNPIECSCSVRWILKTDKRKFSGKCDVPRNLEGRELKSLSDDDFRYCPKP